MLIWAHIIAALMAVTLGAVNLAAEKGTKRHKFLGWMWMLSMAVVTLSSVFIRELNDGQFSWIHGLTAWTIFCMVVAIISIRQGSVRIHAGFMLGTMSGAIIAGLFALMPGRFLSGVLG